MALRKGERGVNRSTLTATLAAVITPTIADGQMIGMTLGTGWSDYREFNSYIAATVDFQVVDCKSLLLSVMYNGRLVQFMHSKTGRVRWAIGMRADFTLTTSCGADGYFPFCEPRPLWTIYVGAYPFVWTR